MRILFLLALVSSSSVYAAESLLTLQHMDARELQKAVTLTHTLPECNYTHYQQGRVLQPHDNFYQGYYVQFWMQGEQSMHRHCLDLIRQKTAGNIRRLDSFLLSQNS